jgi:hypothetical protein
MFMDDIRPFLQSKGWKELSVMHSKKGASAGSVFHNYGDLLLEDLAGNNGIAIWISVDPVDNVRLSVVREFVDAFGSKQ